jgi:hypothetical protein
MIQCLNRCIADMDISWSIEKLAITLTHLNRTNILVYILQFRYPGM